MVYRPGDLMHLVQEDHTDEVRALEDKTLGFLAHLDDALDDLVRRTLTAWTRAFGSPDTQGAGGVLDGIVRAVRAAVRRLLAPIGDTARQALTKTLGPAVRLGAAQGAAFLRAAGARRATAPRVRVGRALRREADLLPNLVADRRHRALALLGRGQVTRWSHLLHAIGAARNVTAAVRGHVAWMVGRAVDAGLAAVADAQGLVRLWVAEANACVRCLAYAGLTTDPRGQFPGGLAWDPRQRHTTAPAIDGPPLHPHCRCRAVPWNPRLHPTPGSIPFPLALQREAHRSIATGTARPTESRAARLRAARELLRTEPDLLPAVETEARTAVRTGRFPVAA